MDDREQRSYICLIIPRILNYLTSLSHDSIDIHVSLNTLKMCESIVNSVHYPFNFDVPEPTNTDNVKKTADRTI